MLPVQELSLPDLRVLLRILLHVGDKAGDPMPS